MHQDSLLELLSKSLDEELSSEEQTLLSQALEEDEELQVLQKELRTLKDAAMNPAPLPSAAVYEQLLKRVQTRYPKSRSLRRLPLSSLATAALVLLAFAAGYFLRPGDPSPEMQPSHNLTLQLLQTRAAYVDAIGRLETMAANHIRQMPPEVAAQVEENLRVVNHAILACESFAQAYPDQLIAFTSLAQAYQAKVELLQTLVYGAQRPS